MGAATEWNPNPPWQEVDATSALHSIRYLAGTGNADPELRDFPDPKKLVQIALRGVRDEIQGHARALRSTFVQHYVHPFHARDWVRVWACADITLSMTHSFTNQDPQAEDEEDEQVYYDWTRSSISGAYIHKTWPRATPVQEKVWLIKPTPEFTLFNW